jgi:oleandomycin transport system permease protein
VITTNTEVPRHVDPLRALRHGLTLAGRSLIKTRKNPESLIDVTVQPVLFMVIFVFLLGGAISGNWHDYLQFVLPGLMVQNAMMASLGTGISLNTDITKGCSTDSAACRSLGRRRWWARYSAMSCAMSSRWEY